VADVADHISDQFFLVFLFGAWSLWFAIRLWREARALKKPTFGSMPIEARPVRRPTIKKHQRLGWAAVDSTPGVTTYRGLRCFIGDASACGPEDLREAAPCITAPIGGESRR
jgi:hypothetical protein